MKLLRRLMILSAFIAAASQAQAQSFQPISHDHQKHGIEVIPVQPHGHHQYCPTPHVVPAPTELTEPTEPAEPTEPITPDLTVPPTEAFTQAPPAGTAGAESFMPQMIGDLGGFVARQTVFVPQTVTTSTQQFSSGFPIGAPVVSSKTVLVPVEVFNPIAARAGSGFKIADDTSPRPQDRLFYTYNYFDSLSGTGGTQPGATIVGPPVPPNAFGTQTTTTIPTTVAAGRTLHLHRHLVGFEKTFFNDNASLELRIPVFHTAGDVTGTDGDLGDISFGFKYAILNDRVTGDVFSLGLMTTAPSGPDIQTSRGDINSWLFQPWAGWIYNQGRFYVHAFHAVLLPTEADDVVALFNDVGIGFNLYQAGGYDRRFVSSVTPTMEVHVTTPLENRSEFELIRIPDIVALTGGVHIGILNSHLLTLGVGFPVTGPNPYDIEAVAQLNFRF